MTLTRLIIAIAICTLSGCATIFYKKTPTGKFFGKLDVEWIAPNQFIYRPHPKTPLIYVTSDGRTIQPRAMYTDAGSIPRLFWSVPEFGPWDFAPGYIIHDWLFEQRHCKEGDWQTYDFSRSAEILAEAIKTQMEKGGSSEPTIVWAIYEAVKTTVAQRSWEHGVCKGMPPDSAMAPALPGGAVAPRVGEPVKLLTIEFN